MQGWIGGVYKVGKLVFVCLSLAALETTGTNGVNIQMLNYLLVQFTFYTCRNNANSSSAASSLASEKLKYVWELSNYCAECFFSHR